MTTRTLALSLAAFALGVAACTATIDGDPLPKGDDNEARGVDDSNDDPGSATVPSSGTAGDAGGNGNGNGNGNGTGGGKKDGGAGDGGDGGDAAPGTDAGAGLKKAFGEVCAADGDCTSNACFKGGMGAYCSFLCTAATAATDCPVPPTGGVCNNQGYCRK